MKEILRADVTNTNMVFYCHLVVRQCQMTAHRSLTCSMTATGEYSRMIYWSCIIGYVMLQQRKPTTCFHFTALWRSGRGCSWHVNMYGLAAFLPNHKIFKTTSSMVLPEYKNNPVAALLTINRRFVEFLVLMLHFLGCFSNNIELIRTEITNHFTAMA